MYTILQLPASGAKVADGSYCFTITAVGATIKTDFFNVYSRSEFGSGNGSPASPYPVANVEQLALVASHNGACFIQTADIDAGLKEITPLFTSDVPFTGTYDGGNHSIKNVSNMIEANGTAIFRAVGDKGVVQNLIVEGSFFSGIHNISALVGINEGTISNCKVKNCSVTTSNGRAGLIAGWNSGTIKECWTSGSTLSIKGDDSDAGGIIGYNTGNNTNNTYVGTLNQVGR